MYLKLHFLGPQYEGITRSSISSRIGINGIENFTWLTFQLLVGQKPSNNIGVYWAIGFDKHSKIPSQYSIYGFITLTYISSFKILDFPNFKYFETPLLMNFSFSIDFKASSPQIGWKKTSFQIPLGSLGQPWLSNFHNQIVGPSLGLHIEFIGNILLYIIGHLRKSTKNWKKCMFVYPTNTPYSSFKYPWTHDLKSRIFFINWGMNGCSCKAINAFIKSANT